MLSILRKVYLLILDSFFPARCLACHEFLEGDMRVKILCSSCASKMNLNSSFFCPSCLARVPGIKKKCHPKTSYLLGAACDYHNPVIGSLVRALKYDGILSSANLLGELTALYLKQISSEWGIKFENFIIVPVPLHPSRERVRGFNQSLLIAEAMSSEVNIKIYNALIRTKRTTPQTDIRDRNKRKANVDGCFSIAISKDVRGKNILLIDDVFTTGATINEAVKTLKNAGARKVIALVAAKA